MNVWAAISNARSRTVDAGRPRSERSVRPIAGPSGTILGQARHLLNVGGEEPRVSRAAAASAAAAIIAENPLCAGSTQVPPT